MYLVTGGAGFIGSHLVERLLADGSQVRVIDDLSTGKMENLAAIANHPKLEIITGDVGDAALVGQAIKGVQIIFHQAALASVEKSVLTPCLSFQSNVKGSFTLFEAARTGGVKRIVLASSSAIYGQDGTYPASEGAAGQPDSPYALDKYYAENLASVYCKSYDLQAVILRYFNVYGPRQDPASPYAGVISRFTEQIKAGKTPVIRGDGKQSRDFVYVKDVVEANIKAMHVSPMNEQCAAACFNIGTGTETSILALLESLCQVYHVPMTYSTAAARLSDIRRSVACIDRAAAGLDWRPCHDLSAGLAAMRDVSTS